jgi:hypothetical protein
MTFIVERDRFHRSLWLFVRIESSKQCRTVSKKLDTSSPETPIESVFIYIVFIHPQLVILGKHSFFMKFHAKIHDCETFVLECSRWTRSIRLGLSLISCYQIVSTWKDVTNYWFSHERLSCSNSTIISINDILHYPIKLLCCYIYLMVWHHICSISHA